MVRLRWFHAGIHVLHCRVCLAHTAITPAAGRPARCTVTVPGDTGSGGVSHLIAHEPQTARRSRSLFNGPPSRLQQAAAHPLRRRAPGTSRYTCYVTMHPIRRGVMPTDRVHHLPQQARPRAIPPHRPQPSASDAATRPRHTHPVSEREALHHLGSITPVSEHYTTSELV